ncbi:MAG: O-antigen ligase family protein [Patescibacteria group bacterium]
MSKRKVIKGETTKSKTSEIVFNWFIVAIVFVIPVNLFKKYLLDDSYITGLLVDYLIPKIYLADILVVPLIIASFVTQRYQYWQIISRHFNWLKWLILIVLIIALRQFFVDKPMAAFYQFYKLIEFSLLSLVIWHNRKIIKLQLVFQSLFLSILFQSAIAIFQFIAQHQLIGFVPLGEPDYGNSLLLSKISIFGRYLISPYGTTSHPNVLAGMVVVYFLIAIFLINKKSANIQRIQIGVMMLLTLVVIVLTQSFSAGLSLFLGLFTFSFHKTFQVIAKEIPDQTKLMFSKKSLFVVAIFAMVVLPLLVHFFAHKFPKNYSLTRRDLLNSSALMMIMDQPLFGQGINQFTVQLEHFAKSKEVIRFIQPAHHTLLLFISETGLIGIALVLIVLPRLNHRQLLWLLILSPILLFDHYFYSQQIGLGMIALSIPLIKNG